MKQLNVNCKQTEPVSLLVFRLNIFMFDIFSHLPLRSFCSAEQTEDTKQKNDSAAASLRRGCHLCYDWEAPQVTWPPSSCISCPLTSPAHAFKKTTLLTSSIHNEQSWFENKYDEKTLQVKYVMWRHSIMWQEHLTHLCQTTKTFNRILSACQIIKVLHLAF